MPRHFHWHSCSYLNMITSPHIRINIVLKPHSQYKIAAEKTMRYLETEIIPIETCLTRHGTAFDHIPGGKMLYEMETRLPDYSVTHMTSLRDFEPKRLRCRTYRLLQFFWQMGLHKQYPRHPILLRQRTRMARKHDFLDRAKR